MTKTVMPLTCRLLLLAMALAPTATRAEAPKLPVPAVDQSALGQRGIFHVGGQYVGEPGKELMHGQAYVEVLVPKEVRRPYPLVLMHGNFVTAAQWMGTPDGRKGWADYFVEQGYIVYLMEQPMRGRSATHPSDGPTRMFTARDNETLFTATATEGTWPQARLHTQFPGEGPNKGKKGDPIFDEWFAREVESIQSQAETQRRNRDAGVALLDRIGPAILLTHSQSGAFGWLIADARPHLVKAIVAVEPYGPPFEGAVNNAGRRTLWGPVDIPIAYAPAINDASELAFEREAAADGPDQFVCWMQKAPARQLANLKNIPVMVMVAEASFHAVFGHCLPKFLNQAGVRTELIRLQDRGIRGNGHIMMIEKNNLDIASVVDDWLLEKLK